MWKLSPGSVSSLGVAIVLTQPDGSPREYYVGGDGWTLLGIIWRAYCPRDVIDPLFATWVWDNCQDYYEDES